MFGMNPLSVGSGHSAKRHMQLTIALLVIVAHVARLEGLTPQECTALQNSPDIDQYLEGATVIDTDAAWGLYTDVQADGTKAAKLTEGGIYKVSGKATIFPSLSIEDLDVVFYDDEPKQLGCREGAASKAPLLEAKGTATVCLYNLHFADCAAPFLSVSEGATVTTVLVQATDFKSPLPLLQVTNAKLLLHSSTLHNNTITTSATPLSRTSGTVQVTLSNSSVTGNTAPSNAPLFHVDYSTINSSVVFDDCTVSHNTAGRLVYAESAKFNASSLRDAAGNILSDNDMLRIYSGAPGAKVKSPMEVMNLVATRAPQLRLQNTRVVNNSVQLELLGISQVHLRVTDDSVFEANKGAGVPVYGSCFSKNATLCGLSQSDQVGVALPDCCVALRLNESAYVKQVPDVMPASWNGTQYNRGEWPPTVDCSTRTAYVLASTLPLNDATSSPGRCGLPPGSRLVSHMIYAYNASILVSNVQWRQNNFSYGSLLETANHTAVMLQGLTAVNNTAQTVLNVTAEVYWLNKKKYQDLRWYDESQRDLNKPTSADTFIVNQQLKANITNDIHDTAQFSPVYVKDAVFQSNKVFVGILRSWGTRDGKWTNRELYDEAGANWYVQNATLKANTVQDIAPQRSNNKTKWLTPSIIGFIHVNATLKDVVLDSNTANSIVNVEVASVTTEGATIVGNQAQATDDSIPPAVVWWTRWATISVVDSVFDSNLDNSTGSIMSLDGPDVFLNGTKFTNNRLQLNSSHSPGPSILSGAGGATIFTNDTTFANNQAQQMVYTNNCKHLFARLNVIGNNGSGVYLDVPAKVFENDYASTNVTEMVAQGNKLGKCGGLYVRMGQRNRLDVTDALFTGNEGSMGGAVCFIGDGDDQENPPRFTVANSMVVNNSAVQGGGGGIDIIGGWLNVTSTNVTGNIAINGSGGGIYAEVVGYVLTNITLRDNLAQSGGGATLKSTCISDGSKPDAICNSTLANSWVENNKVDNVTLLEIRRAGDIDVGVSCGLGGGGGLCIVRPLANKSNIIDTTFRANQADFGGALNIECTSLASDQCRVDMRLTPSTPMALNTATNIGPTVMSSSFNALRVACSSSAPHVNIMELNATSCPQWEYNGQVQGADAMSVVGVGTLPRTMKCLKHVEGSNELQLVNSTVQVISGGKFSVTVQLYDEWDNPIQQLPSNITATASVSPQDLVMVGTQPGDITGAILTGGRTDFPNITVWPTQHDPNNSVYNVTFTATSSYSSTPIVSATLQLMVPRCTLGEYQISESHWCQQCGALNSGNPLFSLHPSVRCEPCVSNGLCSAIHDLSDRRHNSSDNDHGIFGLLLPKSGYFQTSFLLPQVVRCPIPEACKRENFTGLIHMLTTWKEELRVFTPSDHAGDAIAQWLNSMDVSQPNSRSYAKKNAEYMQLQCSTGYEGFLCGACAPQYGRYFGHCQRCLPTWVNTVILLLIVAGVLAIVAFLTLGHMRKTLTKYAGQLPGVTFIAPMNQHTREPYINMPASTTMKLTKPSSCFGFLDITRNIPVQTFEKMSHIFKVLTTFVQVNAITRGLQWVAPRQVRQFFTHVDFTSSPGAWISLDCSLKDLGLSPEQVAIARSMFMIFLPAFCLLVAYTAWILFFAWCAKKRQLPRHSWKNFITPRLWLSTVQICYMLYPVVTINIFDVFKCDVLGAPQEGMESNYWDLYKDKASSCNGTVAGCNVPVWHEKRFWLQNHETECGSGHHAALMWGLGVPALVIFAVGVPVGLVLLLWTRRHKLQEPKTELQFGFLYEEYKQQCSYWEAVIMARKVALLVIIIALPYIRSMYRQYIQISTCIVVMMICLLLHIAYQPFTDQLLNRLETISIMMTIANLYMITYWMIPDMSDVVQLVIMVIMLFLNAAVILYFLYHLFHQVKAGVHMMADTMCSASGSCSCLRGSREKGADSDSAHGAAGGSGADVEQADGNGTLDVGGGRGGDQRIVTHSVVHQMQDGGGAHLSERVVEAMPSFEVPAPASSKQTTPRYAPPAPSNMYGADPVINLRSTHLGSTHLGGTHLSSAHLGGTHLGGTHLGSTHLGGTHLGSTHLGGAHLGSTHLGGAHLGVLPHSDGNGMQDVTAAASYPAHQHTDVIHRLDQRVHSTEQGREEFDPDSFKLL